MLWLAPSPALADWASVVTGHQSHTFFEGATTSPCVKKKLKKQRLSKLGIQH